jgi:nucleoside-diphosphate-sugar epimerase
LKIELILKEKSDIKVIILRPSLLYGTGDLKNLTVLFAIASISKYNKDPLQLLWD